MFHFPVVNVYVIYFIFYRLHLYRHIINNNKPVNMYHMSAQGVDERMINVLYYYIVFVFPRLFVCRMYVYDV